MRASRPPRVPEKHVQQNIVQLLRSIGAAVYVIGRPPRKTTARMGTGQTPGIPDLLVHLPQGPTVKTSVGLKFTMDAHELWIEVKAKGGRLRPEQASFRDFCVLAGIPHVVGGLDEVVTYLHERGYVKEHPALYRRTA